VPLIKPARRKNRVTSEPFRADARRKWSRERT
jgi:hypothetical protein